VDREIVVADGEAGSLKETGKQIKIHVVFISIVCFFCFWKNTNIRFTFDKYNEF
jgi:hypothetical protein